MVGNLMESTEPLLALYARQLNIHLVAKTGSTGSLAFKRPILVIHIELLGTLGVVYVTQTRSDMRLAVGCEMVTPGKLARTQITRVRTCASVFAIVPRQLIRAREPPRAIFPAA